MPYLFVGMTLAAIFSSNHDKSTHLYLADLAGGGVGAILAIPILNELGAIGGALIAGFAFALAAVAIQRRPMPLAAVFVAVLSLVLAVGNYGLGWLDVDMASLGTDKPITDSLSAGGEIIDTDWDSFARTDLVAPASGGPLELYIDGAAGSLMPAGENNDALLRDIGLFPFATAQPAHVFIVGPGGGLDVYFGLLAQAEEIVAVEVNPGSVRVVKDFAEHNGFLYEQSSVRVVVDEGRSLMRREGAQYDLIYLSQVVTLAADRSGYTLTENTIYTVEAFREYLTHLRQGGQIALKLYDESTLTRALTTVIAALTDTGMSDAQALRHTAAFLDGRSDPPIPLLLVRETAFSPAEASELGQVARRVGFTPLYLPGIRADPPLDGVEAGVIRFQEIIARSPTDISPTSDDRPFFFHFGRGLPRQLRGLLISLAGIVLVGGAGLAYAMRKEVRRTVRWAPLYFAALGAGFITIEVVAIQQTRLFLGHPTLAVTVTLATLLMGGGIGSYLAGRWVDVRAQGIPEWPAILVAGLASLWTLAWPHLSGQFLDAGNPARLALVMGSLLPLALAMGMPFPIGLRVVGMRGSTHVARGWAVNGVMSVVGSAGAVAMAITFGFTRALMGGVLAYAAAALAAWVAQDR